MKDILIISIVLVMITLSLLFWILLVKIYDKIRRYKKNDKE